MTMGRVRVPIVKKVAVIGAGSAGLVTARELQREGLQVVVFEKADRIGGTWVYDPKIEEDPLGLDPDRKRVHSSIYRSLRTNLPTHLMGFSDFPFNEVTADHYESEPMSNFPGHEQVLKYLNNFATDFGLTELIRFNTEVVRVEQEVDSNHWVAESKGNGCDQSSRKEELFDAVVVCNGHYTQPRLAELPGIKNWPGKHIHSHNYRVPEPFGGQVIVVIGGGPSAYDICEDIAKVAKEVHLSSRSSQIEFSNRCGFNNVWQHPEVNFCHENGEIAFKDGALVFADIILYCTGYNYEYPFLRTNGIVTVDDNCVGPLYKHVFPPELAPSLSFVGIPFKSVIFFTMEFQAKWIAHVLSGKTILPSKVEMLADVKEHYRHMEENGVPKHHMHALKGVAFEYLDWLAAEAGFPPVDDAIKKIYAKYFQVIADSYPWVGPFRDLNIDSLIV